VRLGTFLASWWQGQEPLMQRCQSSGRGRWIRLRSSSFSPPGIKASHTKVKNPKYSSPSPGFWEEAIRVCSNYGKPVLNKAEAAVQESAGASPAEGGGSSRAGPRPVEGQTTPVFSQRSKHRRQSALLLQSGASTSQERVQEPEAGNPDDVQAPDPKPFHPVKDSTPGEALGTLAGRAVVDGAPCGGGGLEAGGPVPLSRETEQQGAVRIACAEQGVSWGSQAVPGGPTRRAPAPWQRRS